MADESSDGRSYAEMNAQLRARVAELEAVAREHEERFRALVEGAFDGLAISVGGRIVEANAVFAKLCGYARDEVLGMTPLDLAAPESAAFALERIRDGSEAPYEAMGLRKDGTTFPCEVLGRNIVYQGQPARLTGFRDVTERRRLEQRMRHTQKLETLGVLAGGIAHEFNNLMLIVLGHAELSLGLLTKPGGNAAAAEPHLEHIKTAVQRARELTSQMLTYAGRAQPEPEVLDLPLLVRETCELFAGRAQLQLELGPDLPALEADPAQLRQLLANLITNAVEALPDPSGQIALRASRCAVGVAELERMTCDHSRGAGEFVRLEVEDRGCGMDRSTRERAFEPFFSTKWKGRGLGLAAVLGIVRAHRGALDVHSEPDQGARFRVFFPSCGKQEPSATDDASSEFRSLRSQGLALLADDERMLRNVGAEILRSVGFEVLTAKDGSEALELFTARAAEITLVLLDATMPRMGGVDVLRAIRELGHDTPVVLMSGFHDADPGTLADDPHAAFLAKPFEIETLLRKLRELMAG